MHTLLNCIQDHISLSRVNSIPPQPFFLKPLYVSKIKLFFSFFSGDEVGMRRFRLKFMRKLHRMNVIKLFVVQLIYGR